MAQIVKTMPNPKTGATKYPWDEWLDGKIRKLTKGEDFELEMEAMRSSVHMAAGARGIKAQTRVVGTELYIQGFPHA